MVLIFQLIQNIITMKKIKYTVIYAVILFVLTVLIYNLLGISFELLNARDDFQNFLGVLFIFISALIYCVTIVLTGKYLLIKFYKQNK